MTDTTMLASINPADGSTIGEVPLTPADTIESIVADARRAFPAWGRAPLRDRAHAVKRAQQLLLERSDEFAALATAEMGRPVNESLSIEITGCLDLLGYYAANAGKFLNDQRVPLHNLLFRRRKSSLHFEPLGVLGIIAPWNWPLLIPLGGIVPALLSGNCVVFKHSHLTPLLADRLHRLFLDAGIPEHVFQIVQGGADQGRALVDSSVEKIFFTGSTAVGKMIYRQAAASLKKCVLEMGGSDPAIVCGDADIEYTSSGILWGGFCNCGQNCNSIERVYVHRTVSDAFTARLVEKVKTLRIGAGDDPETDIGPLASADQLNKIDDMVRRSLNAGAEPLCGGKRGAGAKGYFYEPTVLLWNGKEASVTREEFFGPVVNVFPVDSEDEAVARANDSDFGLASSVWTGDAKKGMRIARRLEAGTVMINDVIVSFGMAEAGWTGIKKSGIGWVHGEKGLDEMVNIKYINRDPQDQLQKFWWFPYTHTMLTSMRKGMQFMFSGSVVRRLTTVPGTLRAFTGYLLSNRRRGDKV
ncbi:aldehyde dehydrogenase family protein [bacterium]|nr:aldehyde dehydrogenase family protein [bacterium]